MWTINYILSQILVLISIGLFALTFLLKSKKSILIVSIINTLLTIFAFVLLGAYTGAYVNLITLVRSLWFFCEEKNGKHTWFSLVIIIILIVCVTIFAYQSIIDLLPLFAAGTYTIACWQKNITVYCWLGMAVNIIDIVYDIYYNSIVGVIGKLIALVCALFGLVMGYVKKGKDQTISQDKELVSDKL